MTSIFKLSKKDEPSIKNQSSSSIFKAKKSIPEIQEFFPQEDQQEGKKSFTQGAYEQLREFEEGEKDVERHQARQLSRMGERVLGLPGDIYQFLNTITGGKGEEFPLPTSASLKEKSERLSQGYTKAQNEFEEKTDEIMGDIASMAIPGASNYSLVRNLGIPIVANLAKEGLEGLGWQDKNSSYAKMGTMIVGDLLLNRGRGGARGLGNRLLQESEQSIPRGATTSASKLENAINTLEQDLSRGGSSPSKTRALTKINEVRDRINNGMIEVSELPAFRKSINEMIEELGGWGVELPKGIKTKAVNNLNQVKKAIIETGIDYGTYQNPTFGRAWQQGNEALAAVNQSNVISNFIKKNFGNPFKSTSTKLLFGLGGTSAAAIGTKFAPAASILSGGTAGALSLGYQAYKIAHRVWNSPVLRRYYSNVLNASARGSVGQMSANMAALDKKIAEEEKKEEIKIKKLLRD